MRKIFILFLLSISILAEGEFPVMLKLKTKGNLNDNTLRTLRAGIEMSLTQKNYSLIDQKAQEEALKEQVSQQKSECYDDNCLVDVGRMIAARALFIVDITKLGNNKYLFKARFVDLETAETKKTIAEIYTYSLSDSKKLLSFSKKFVSSLLAKKIIIRKTIDIEINTDKTDIKIINGKCKFKKIDNRHIEFTDIKDNNCKIEITKLHFYKIVKKLEFNKERDIKIEMKKLKKYPTKFIFYPLDSKAILTNVRDKKDVINLKSGDDINLYEKSIYNLNIEKMGYERYHQTIYTNVLKDQYIISLYKPTNTFFTSYGIFDTTITSYLKYMSIGAGTQVYSRKNRFSFINVLAVNFYRNLTDNYFYFDIELAAYKLVLFDTLTFGVSVSLLPIFAKDFIFTQTGNLDIEYKYNLTKKLYINAKVRAGLSNFKSTDKFRGFLTSGIQIGYNGF